MNVIGYRHLLAWIFAALILTGCGGGSGRSTDSTATTAFVAQTAAKTLGAFGGTLSLTLTDGTKFDMVIPAGALAANTDLSLSSQAPVPGQRFNVVMKPAGLILAGGANANIYVTLPAGQTLPATAGLIYNSVPVPYTVLSDGRIQVNLTYFANSSAATVQAASIRAAAAVLMGNTSAIRTMLLGATATNTDPCAGAASAPPLNSNGGLTVNESIAVAAFGTCMVGAINNMLTNEQFAEAMDVANAMNAYKQVVGKAINGDPFAAQAKTALCSGYSNALGRARNTTVTSMGQLKSLTEPIMFWEASGLTLDITCDGIGVSDFDTVIRDKTTEALAYYAQAKPAITDTTSSQYAAARTEASQTAETKREVLALNPGAGVRATLNSQVTQRAQPGVLDAMLQAPWNNCNSFGADYTELMNLMVTLDSPDSVKDAAQYCGTLLQAQTKNLAGTVIDTLAPNLGGVSASQKRTSGSVKAAKNAKLVLDGPIQAMKCPAGSASGETLTLKLDGTTLQSGLTAPYLSNPLEIDIAAALETAHPNATAALTQAVLTLERTGSTCGDFWGVNPVPLLSITLSFTERKIVFSVQFAGPDALPGNEIHSINPNGSGNTALTTNDLVFFPEIPGEAPGYWGHLYDDSAPAMSPDGSQITFGRTHQGLMVMSASGGGTQLLTPPSFASTGGAGERPAWSPDGTKIAFNGYADASNPATNGIYVINATGGNPNIISNFASSGLAWSPDGTKLLSSGYQGNSNSTYGLYVMNADGTGSATQLISGPGFSIEISSSAWSPDGSKLVFAGVLNCTGANCSVEIWVTNANGSNPQSVYAFPAGSGIGYGSFPSWSPDGGKIAFTDRHDIYVMNADGSDLTNISNYDSTKHAVEPAWR